MMQMFRKRENGASFLSTMDGQSDDLNTPQYSPAACSANTDETFHVSSWAIRWIGACLVPA